MERSLSVLLPVRNAQSTLAATVSRVLEQLPEVATEFELVIVDDGSTDATIEVADELAARYPQIRVVSYGLARGRAAAIRAGLESSRGEVVVLHGDPLGDHSGHRHRLASLGYRWHDRPSQRQEDAGAPISGGPLTPNFLTRLRDLALGE